MYSVVFRLIVDFKFKSTLLLSNSKRLKQVIRSKPKQIVFLPFYYNGSRRRIGICRCVWEDTDIL